MRSILQTVQNNLGNGTFPLMGNLRVLILDSCSINTLHPDTFLNLGRASTTYLQKRGLHSKMRSQMNIEEAVE
jgi:hypothetical protein